MKVRPVQHIAKLSYSLLPNVLLLLLLFLGPVFLGRQAHVLAASKTWDGGCGANTNWSCQNNWSDNIVPAAGDTVTFDNTSDNNSTVDAAFNASETITTININTGYDGTITLATTLHVTTSYVQGGATSSFTAANQTLDLNGTFTLSAGSFTSSSGTTSLAGAMTISGSPTFRANGGTWTFDGSTTRILSCNNVTFNAVTLGFTSGNQTINSNCSLPLGANPTSAGGSIILNGTLSGSGTLTTSSTFTLATTYALTGFTGLVTNTLTINTGTTANFGSYTTFDINGAFTASGTANVTMPSGTATFAIGFTLNSSNTFNANGGTITFDGTSGTIACGSKTFNAVNISHTGNNAKVISSDCSLPLGNNPTIGGDANADVTLNGTLSGTGTLTVGTTSSSNALTVNSTSPLSGFSTLSAGVINISGGTFTAPAMMNVSSTFTLNSATTWSANGGTVNFTGALAATLACGNKTFNLVTFTHTGANAKTVGSDCSLPLGNNPTIGGDVNADVTLNGTLSGTGTLTIGTAASNNLLTLNSTAALSGFSGLNAGTITVTGATIDFGSYTSFALSGGYSQTGGTITAPDGADFNSTFSLGAAGSGSVFNAPSGTMTLSGSVQTINTGNTFNANGGTVVLDGAGHTITCAATTFNFVQLTSISGTTTVNSGCTLPLGNNPSLGSGSVAVTVNGTLSGTGTVTTTTATGALTLGSDSALSGFTGLVSNALTVTGGINANFGNFTTFDVNGAFSTSGSSTITAPSGTATFAAAFTLNSHNTFNANGGTITFDGSISTATISCGGQTFNLVTFNHNPGTTRTVSSDCNLPLGNNPSWGQGTSTGSDITLNGTLSGTGTLTTGPSGGQVDDITIGSTGTLSGFSGLVMNGTLTINGATLNLGSYNTVDLNRHFVLSAGGVFTAPSGTMTVANTFTLDAGTTFNANGGTLTFDGGGSVLTCNGATFNLVTFAHTSGSKTVSSGCSFPLGANPTTSVGGIVLTGTLSGSGTLTTGGNLTLNTGYALSGFSGLTIDTAKILTINATNANFGSFTTFDDNGDFILNAGATFTAPSGTMSIAAGLTIVNSLATFNANGGTVNFDDAGSQADDANLSCGNSTFNLVTFTHASGTKLVESDCSLPLGVGPTAGAGGSVTVDGSLSGSGTLTTTGTFTQNTASGLSGFAGLQSSNYTGNASANFGSYNTFDVNGNFIVQSGATFTATAATMTVGGNFTVESGSTFTPNGGTVILDGSNQVIAGTNTFYNLSKTVASAASLTFPAGSTQTILNDLVLKGTASQLLSLVSSAPGTNWIIDLHGAATVCSVDVTDSYSSGNTILAYSSFSNSTNTGWTFNDAACGGGSGRGGSSGVTSPVTTVTNFEFTQAAIAAAAENSQLVLSNGAINQTLRSPISSIFSKIPKGPGVVRSILGFFAICLIGFIALVLGFWWLVTWYRRYSPRHWLMHVQTQ